MADTKVAVLFRGVLSDLNPAYTKTDQACYILSLRNGSPQVEYTSAARYEDVALHYPDPRMPVNSCIWADEDPQLLESVFFHSSVAGGEVWYFVRKAGERLLKRCLDLGIECCDLRYLPSGARHPHTVVGLRFQSAEQLSSAFWPDNLNLLFDAIFLGLRMSLPFHCEDIQLTQGSEFMTGVPYGPNLNQYFAFTDIAAPDWAYTVKSDFSFFDSGDPICCVSNQDAPTFEKEITEALRARGYAVHRLPLLGPLLLNWTNAGEIPLLS